MWDIAEEFGAALVFAEHRFYGKSYPFGDDSYTTVKNLGYLTSEQALADYAELITFLKSQVNESLWLNQLKFRSLPGPGTHLLWSLAVRGMLSVSYQSEITNIHSLFVIIGLDAHKVSALGRRSHCRQCPGVLVQGSIQLSFGLSKLQFQERREPALRRLRQNCHTDVPAEWVQREVRREELQLDQRVGAIRFFSVFRLS
jgi:hypothetical protein